MRGLFLCGYGCKPWIWDKVKNNILSSEDVIKFIEWPKSLLSNFNKIGDFSIWVKENFINKDEEYDFIGGHSMGGLIALELSTMDGVSVRNTILVESYLTSPGKFFQNLLMETADEKVKEEVMAMLKEESKYYSEEVRENLRTLDITDLVNKSKSKIHCIYGDRGMNNRGKVIRELGLPLEIEEKLNIGIVRNSCHFPMIENSEEIVEHLRGWGNINGL